MNKRLKFSWGHIIAFLALIFIAYVTFMGITYLTLGDFVKAGIGCVLCTILIAASILGAQVLKGTPTQFYKRMEWERVLIFISPLMLLLAFYPYNHFWNVLSQEDEIVSNFKDAIKQAHGIFDEYENYANERCNVLSSSLSNIAEDKRNNRIEELRLLLLSQNYEKLKTEANGWIENAAQSSTVWNVFLLGNVEEIKDAVDKWTQKLYAVSAKHLSCEGDDIQNFNADTPAKQSCNKGLDTLKEKYSEKNFKLNPMALVTMLVCWVMLMLPYFIQERHAANCEKFWDFGFLSNFYGSRGREETIIPNHARTSATKQKKDTNYPTTNEEGTRKQEFNPKTRKGAPV